MINLKRNRPAPQSLANKKLDGVKEALIEEFFYKCYLCEQKNPVSSEIEHFKPSSRFPHLKYDWSNLYLVCHHCNTIKNYTTDQKKQEIELLNCTNVSPIITDVIAFKGASKPKEKVMIEALDTDPIVIDTAKLLQTCFNPETPDKAFDGKALTDAVVQELKKVIDLVHNYFYEAHTQEKKQRLLGDIKDLLAIEAPFSAFKIWFIKANYKDYPEFMALLPSFN